VGMLGETVEIKMAEKPATRSLSPRTWGLLQDRANGMPVWIRSPKAGTEFYTGLSRSKLYDLANKRQIRSVSIREPNQIRGTRLFNLKSILDLFERIEEESLKNN
jgi:hypothetical protein